MSTRDILGVLKAIWAQLPGAETLVALGAMTAAAVHTLYLPFASLSAGRRLSRWAFAYEGEVAALAEITRPNQSLDLWVQGLLSYLRPLDCYRSSCDVNRLVEEALSALGQQLAARELDVELHLAPLPKIALDPLWIEQALLSILTNALDASTRKGHVAITSEASAGLVSVSIAYGEKGAVRAPLARAFGLSSTSKSGAAGLGLTTAKGIVAAHRGHLTLDCQTGKGTTVTIHLPLALT
jgi:signal transduction histidine kinase